MTEPAEEIAALRSRVSELEAELRLTRDQAETARAAVAKNKERLAVAKLRNRELSAQLELAKRPLWQKLSDRALSKKRVGPIVYQPGNLSGHVDHYYHFLLGYLLPSLLDYTQNGADRKVLLRDCGLMNRHFGAFNGWEYEIFQSTPTKHAEVRRIEGFDQPSGYDATKLRNAAGLLYDDSLVDGEREIVIIDRGATGADSGASRRSVPNMAEICDSVQRTSKTRLVTLEEMDLPAQAQLFNRASVIIAQHGAALANMIFCRPDAHVVEILPPRPNAQSRQLFGDLAATLGLKYSVVVQASAHAAVDPALVLEAVN